MLNNKSDLFSFICRYRYLFYILLLIPVYIFRDYTPANELKYISIVEESIKNNTWFTFYNHGEAYADKPPLFFWLIKISRLITGNYLIGLIGLFSLLPAVGVFWVMDKWLKQQEEYHNSVVSNLMLLTCAIFLGGAMVVRMDMLMTFFIVLSLYTFFRLFSGNSKSYEKFLLPVYIFLAVFSKGPMGFLIPVASILAFLLLKKKLKTIGRYLGWKQWAILLGLCAAWFSCIYVEGGNEYLNNILFKQTVGRGVNSFHHKEPVWFYFPRMLWSFAPWSLLLIAVYWKGVRNKIIRTDTEKFFLTVAVVNIIMLSLVSAKLDIYMLPIYPFAVYLGSVLLCRVRETKLLLAAVCIPAFVMALLFPSALLFKSKIPYELDSYALIYTGLFILFVFCLYSLFLSFKHRIQQGIIALSGGMLLMIFTVSFALPQFNRYLGFGVMVESAKKTAMEKCIDNFTYYKFYTAPNMDVYLGEPPVYVGSIEELQMLNDSQKSTILFVRRKDVRRDPEFRMWLGMHEHSWESGDYSWYILGGEDMN